MKKILLTLAVSTLLLGACSKNDNAVTLTESATTQTETTETVSALQKRGTGLQGSWSFCHDKTLTEENVIESCTLYDTFLWQFDDGNITVGKVVEPLVKQDCTTQCYSAPLANIKVNNVASGNYTKESDAIIVEVTDSNDLVNFPKCQVKWSIIGEADEQHQKWQLENINCETAIYDFKTWVKKVS
tara:strand:+ start:266 stop:823 length:558 start_codon:yes stop_codon:yes gene_type:complete